jgi:5'-nucleotidase/UDP-sugar diphosphatase
MRRLLFAVLFALPLSADTTVTLLHFSDYHSHAVPFYTEEGERGGIARAAGYLRQEKRRGALVFSGGDMVNQGAPAWSDKYQCVEWPWLNGIVDAMAFGNHDADYGHDAFLRCRDRVTYPILSANTNGFRAWHVVESRGVRIGVFAVAGTDFPQLVKVPELTFGDPVAAARVAVEALRTREKVDAVVMIGHQHAESDYALAAQVPGIDLIFGTHSHLRRDLTRIPGTSTWFISPSQYLSFISRVELTFDDGGLTNVAGRLVPVDDSLPEWRRVARRVRRMQRELERDPAYRELFAPIGRLDAPLSVLELSRLTLDTMRRVTNADVALSTVSSFRRALPSGTLTPELLRAALPYDNEIVVCTMNGAQLQRVLDESKARTGSDSESYVTPLPPLDAAGPYRVATTDYLAFVAYKDAFQCEKQRTGVRVRSEVTKVLAK